MASPEVGVGVATAIVWVRRARQAGDRKAHQQGAAKPSKLEPHRDFLLGLIDATPDLTLNELLARLLEERGVKAARSTLWTFLDRCGLTFKKTAQDRPGVRKRREDWFDGQLALDPEHLVFIDDTWVTTNMARLRGRALKGDRLCAGIPHGHWKTTTFIGGLRRNGLGASHGL